MFFFHRPALLSTPVGEQFPDDVTAANEEVRILERKQLFNLKFGSMPIILDAQPGETIENSGKKMFRSKALSFGHFHSLTKRESRMRRQLYLFLLLGIVCELTTQDQFTG